MKPTPSIPGFSPVPPRRFPAVMLVGAAYMVFLTYDQMHWWGMKADYSFGWLVPLFISYVLFERWPRMRECYAPVAASPLSTGWNRVVTILSGLSLAGGLVLFAMGALYRAGTGPTQPGSLAMAAGFAGILLGAAGFDVPSGSVPRPADGSPGPRWQSDSRLRAAALLLFPALVWVISAPLVTAVESAISLFLLHRVVAVVFTVFGVLGYPLVQEGNVLMLPKGPVGVAEACSGIRSLTACLFAGSFLGSVFFDRWWKKVALVVAAMGFAFLMNLARGLFLTGWAYAYGPAAISGTVHDVAGYSVLALTCAGLLALVPLLNLRLDKMAGAGPEPAAPAVGTIHTE